MRTVRTLYIPLLLVALTAPALRSQQCADTTVSPVVYPNTADGLHCLLKDMRMLAAHGEHDKLAAAVKRTEIPNSADWFHKTYPESADSWIGPYQAGLEQNDRALQEVFENLATVEGDFSTRKVNDSPQPGRGMEWGMLQSMKRPVDIYFASWKDTQSDPNAKGDPVGYFMYIDGEFRWDSLIRFVKMKSSNSPGTVPNEITHSTRSSPEGPVYKVGAGVTAPRVLDAPDPQYSKEAQDSKVEGVVILSLIVGPNGLPRDIRIQKPVGHGLDEKAIEAVSKWKFQPATKDGKPVAVHINVEVNFRLR